MEVSEHPGAVLKRLCEREHQQVKRERLYAGPSRGESTAGGYVAAMMARSWTGSTAQACAALGEEGEKE